MSEDEREREQKFGGRAGEERASIQVRFSARYGANKQQLEAGP